MNERIKLLAEQCWDWRLDGRHFDQEKFALLIIQECVQVLVNRNAPNVYGEHIGVEEIKQHFGVK